MNLHSLDNNLRALTSSEKKYLSGEKGHAFDKLPLVDCNGQKVKLMLFSNTSEMISNNFLYIKKQSRFQACPAHIHDWIEINYMYSGQCPQIINGTSYVLEQGQVVLIDTDTPHSTSALEMNDIMISLVISKEFLNINFFNRLSKDSILSKFFINAINKNTRHDNFILFHSENSRKLPLFFNELVCEFYDPSINSPDMVSSLFTLVLCELINIYENDIGKKDLNIQRNSVIPILRYIEGNYNNCTLESTAEFFNINSNYLTTLLKQTTGNSYKELVQHQRLTKACQLLRNTDFTVTDVANQVGYENMNFFYRKFKDKYHCSPKEYRMTYVNNFD